MKDMTCSCGEVDLDNAGWAHCDLRQELRQEQHEDQWFQQGRNTLLGRGAAQVHMCWDCRFARV
jgi:hypothetical protein